MKKSLILISILILLPFIALAQFDFDTLFDTSDIVSNITINSFELIWSCDTYTPFKYEGRGLPSIGSKITVEAIIIASGGDVKDLKYSWFLEDIFQQSKSGYGRDSFYFYVQQRAGAYHTIKLQVFNENRTIFQEKTIEIPIVEPELVINSSTISLGREFLFKVRPYFFSINKLTDLTFEWHFAGQEPIISSDYDASILDLIISEKEDKEILEKELWVSATNKQEPRQKAYQSIKVQVY